MGGVVRAVLAKEFFERTKRVPTNDLLIMVMSYLSDNQLEEIIKTYREAQESKNEQE